MEKIIRPSDWSWAEKIATVIPFSSRGLTSRDCGVLVKRASEEIAAQIRNVDLKPGDVPVHVIAMGATEAYGSNRNGDGFKEASLKKYHPTFVKYAKPYRHHKNKVKANSYGKVAMSFYNDKMRRVELLLLLNGTKEAAARNGGFIADKELDILESNSDLPVSMACRIDFDKCSSCGNEAKTREEYCDEDDCVGPAGEKRGGCKHNLTKVSADGHVLHVDNPHPEFFDISTVFRPADRIAYGNKVDYLVKAASAGDVIGGAALAEAFGIVTPVDVYLDGCRDAALVRQIKSAYQLAATEEQYCDDPTTAAAGSRVFYADSFAANLDHAICGKPGTEKFASFLASLTDQKVVLPYSMFVTAFEPRRGDKIASVAEDVTPWLFNAVLRRADFLEKLASNPYLPAARVGSSAMKRWAASVADSLSFSPDALRARAIKSAIHGADEPALISPREHGIRSLSEPELHYALYKIAALSSFDDNVPLTASLFVLQNYVKR